MVVPMASSRARFLYLIPAGMVAYGMAASPPYAYFDWMKTSVVIGALLLSRHLWDVLRDLPSHRVVVSVVPLAIGVVHGAFSFGSKPAWTPWNLLAIGMFLTAAFGPSLEPKGGGSGE